MTETRIGPTRYAAWRSSPLGGLAERLEHEALLDLAGPLAGLNVLDIGCGDGVLGAKLAAAGAKVTGVDANPAMIGQAQRAAPGATFLVGDACRLPVPSAGFDLAVINTVLCLVKDRRSALAEAARVLQSGGRLVIGELGRWSLWAAARRLRGWLGALPWREAHFSTPASLAAELASVGLVVGAVRGAVFFPPWMWAAQRMAPWDSSLGRRTTLGAAYLAVRAQKPIGQTG
ncbi:MAG: methyltransferase domain-containing protein [Rhodospirillales bacterium]|nr:methyltransferase domain-containing protein [Rhodospirillales bacterium]